jgi:hypothetical protein
VNHARLTVAAVVLWSLGVLGTVILVSLSLRAGGWTTLAFLALAPVNIGYGFLGLVILRHHPRHRIGWIYLATPILVSAVFDGFGYSGQAIDAGTVTFVHVFVIWLAAVLFTPMALVMFPLVALVFPDGDLPGRRWRWPAGGILGAAAVSSLLLAFAPGMIDPTIGPNPFAIPALGPSAIVISGALMVLAIVGGTLLAIAAMVVRFRRGGPQERQQLKWVLAALLVIAALVIPSLLATSGENGPEDVISGLSLLLLPLSMTVAILRYRLYEIDRIISRTLAYGVVTAVLVATFAGTVLALQGVLAGVTGGDTVPVALSTLMVFALFQPLRSRVQRAIDRRFHRAGVDATHAIETFGSRLRDELDLSAVGEGTLATADRLVHPRSASLWLRRP